MSQRIIIPLVLLFLLASSYSIAYSSSALQTEPQYGSVWEVMASLPEPRVHLAVVADGTGFLYAFGGYSAYDDFYTNRTNTSFRYNSSLNTWDTVAPIPVPLAEIDAGFVGGKIYIPGDSTTATTYIYTIATNTWSEIPSNGGFTSRSQYKVVVSGTDLYLLGGCCDDDTYTEVWILDTSTGSWSPGVPMNYKRQNLVAGFVGGKLYAAGGYKASDDNVTSIEVFDGARWKYLDGRIPSNCEGDEYPCYGWSHMANAVGPQGFWLAGGWRGQDIVHHDHVALYEPITESWVTSPEIPLLNYPRTSASGSIAGDYFYVIGGALGADISPANERLFIGEPARETSAYRLFLPVLRR